MTTRCRGLLGEHGPGAACRAGQVRVDWAAGERLVELARLVEGPVGDVVRTLSSACFEVQRFGLCLEVMCGVWRRLMTRSERELWDR